MEHYSLFSNGKLNNLLTKLLNNPDEITVSEKLILIGNLSEKLNKETGTIVNTINMLITKDRDVNTMIAPSTLNNLLSDVHIFLSSNYGKAETLTERYDYLDVTMELNKNTLENRSKILTYKPSIKTLKEDSNKLNGKNGELGKLIQNLDLDLIIKIYVVVLGIM